MRLTRAPRVLFINAWDGEDYGVQYVFDGLSDMLGSENVIDWPSNEYCHHSPIGARSYDSQVSWPTKYLQEHDIRDLFIGGFIDLVVISSGRVPAHNTVAQWVPWMMNARTAIVLLDMEDSEELTVGGYFEIPPIAPGILAVFKREHREGRAYPSPAPVVPFPFGYPRSRAVGLGMLAAKFQDLEAPLCFARLHDWNPQDQSPRRQLVTALREAFGDRAETGLSDCQDKVWTNRLGVDEYHARLARSWCGVSMRGAGSDTNRYWEIPAHGAILISDRPVHTIPNNFRDGAEAFFYDTPEQAVSIIRDLSRNPHRAMQIACAGYEKFLQCHTTTARAALLLATVAELYAQRAQRWPDWVAG